MRRLEVSKRLEKTLTKLAKKDPKRYDALFKKIEEILESDVDRYKNLRTPLKHLKRVHIDSSFVLTFGYDAERDVVRLYDFDHHDRIYGE